MSDKVIIDLPTETPRISPETCEHKEIHCRCNIHMEINPDTKVSTRYCQVTVQCRICNTPFSFKGALKESSDFDTVGTTDHLGFTAVLPIIPGHQVFKEFMQSRAQTLGVGAMGTPAEQTEKPTVTPRQGKGK
jgi:hypothetical protein